MKKGKFLVTVGFLTLTACAYAQTDYTFRVLANKGTNEVKSGETWQALKTGTSLNKGDELKISENAYLGLVHSSGKPIELKKAGSYKVSDLADQMPAGKTASGQYVDFVLSSNTAEAKKNRLSATGAVHRGIESVLPYLPGNDNSDKAGVYNDKITITWESKDAGPFNVKIMNMFEDQLFTKDTPENTVEVNLADPMFGTQTNLLVVIASKVDGKIVSERILVRKLTPEEKKVIKAKLDAEMGTVNEESALNELLLAGFYEKQGLLIDAVASYEKAIKLAPDVPTYKEDFEEFLFRTQIKKPQP